MLYSPPDTTMSSLLSEFPALSVSLIHLVFIIVAALLINRLLRLITQLIIRPAATQSRAALAREQQTRTMSGVVYSGASKVVWALALLMAAQEFGLNVTPVAAVAGLAGLAVGFGAQNLVRDIITGFYIILEDQYSCGRYDSGRGYNRARRASNLTANSGPRLAGSARDLIEWGYPHGWESEP